MKIERSKLNKSDFIKYLKDVNLHFIKNTKIYIPHSRIASQGVRLIQIPNFQIIYLVFFLFAFLMLWNNTLGLNCEY